MLALPSPCCPLLTCTSWVGTRITACCVGWWRPTSCSTTGSTAPSPRNNVLNPFTPFGDCSLLRMANLYANICQVGKRDDIRECFEMITARSARLMRRDDYGVEVGKTADLVVLDCQDRESAVAEVVTPLYGFKRGRPTFTRRPARTAPAVAAGMRGDERE